MRGSCAVWIERVWGAALAIAGGAGVVAIFRLTGASTQGTSGPIWQNLVMMAAMLPFSAIPASVMLMGLRHLLGERRWIERSLGRLKLALFTWIAVVGGGLVIILTVHAFRYYFGP